MKQQLFFELQETEKYGDFLTSESNQNAVSMIDLWPNWDISGLIIYGPDSSGKTHLLHKWAKQAQAHILGAEHLSVENAIAFQEAEHLNFAIDNADEIVKNPEHAEALFHLYNMTKNKEGYILLTATTDIAGWDCTLPDLLSRLKTFTSTAIEPPDTMLLQTLLVKYFSDRQTNISPDVISYILKRVERSCSAISDFAEELDREALAQRRPISIPLAREILTK